jgi:hypothetical protein
VYEQEETMAQERRLDPQDIAKIQKMKMGQSSKECSICASKFEKGFK